MQQTEQGPRICNSNKLPSYANRASLWPHLHTQGSDTPIQIICCSHVWVSSVAQMVKNPPAVQETWVRPLDWKDSLRRERLPIPVFWPREFHEQRSLVGYSPWGCKESDTTERISLSFVYIYRLPGWLSW